MAVAAYLRVSSRSQSVESQRFAVERAAAARGEQIDRWHEEKLSGRSLDRPELAEVRAAARRGELSALYVFRLDRLTRSGIRDTFEVVEDLRRYGCRLVTVADGFDPSGPAGDVVLAVLAFAAQLEREAAGDRIRAARERMTAEQKKKWGRPRKHSRAMEARVLELLAAGQSVRDVAITLRIPRASVQNLKARSEEP